MFTAADFELFQPRFQGDPEWNGRRLDVRHRLQALGDRLKETFASEGIALDRRESLHHPHHTNRQRVRRQRTMLFRAKRERQALQRFLGKELGKDLDSARNNLHFQVGLDRNACWWGLRIDAGAWYDLNVLLKRAEEAPGQRELREAGAAASPGFLLEVESGGPRPLEKMTAADWRDLGTVLEPGRSSLEVVRRLPAAEAVAAGEGLEDEIVAGLRSLAPLYRLACWTLDGGPAGASL
ncbi:MAG: hypothetical protein D6702_03805 [Planctomycetota bacterium]|nr:MAG: hypothetical protein D6702_03805 [Planctomycetota bacterium]